MLLDNISQKVELVECPFLFVIAIISPADVCFSADATVNAYVEYFRTKTRWNAKTFVSNQSYEQVSKMEQAPYLKLVLTKNDMVSYGQHTCENVSLSAFSEATGHSARPSTVICSCFNLPQAFFSKVNMLLKNEISFLDAVQDLHEDAKRLGALLEYG